MQFANNVLFRTKLLPKSRVAALILPLFALITSCSDDANRASSKRERISDSVNAQKILIVDRPPIVIAKDAVGVENARTLISRLTPSKLQSRKGAKFVDANALPWLSGSTPGKTFMTSPPNRILVRGNPAEMCPVAFTTTGSAGTPTGEVAHRALTKCLEKVPPGCGCQVVAMRNALLTKREEISYATGIAARIRSRALGLDDLLVAEEQPSGTILLRDLTSPIGTLTFEGKNSVSMTLKGSGAVFTGTVRDVGFRRGRLARRIYVKSPGGDRISLLIGFDPDELAQFAGAWLAWPPDA